MECGEEQVKARSAGLQQGRRMGRLAAWTAGAVAADMLLLGGASMAEKGRRLTGAWECVAEQAAFSTRDTAEGVIFQGKLWLSNGYHAGNILSRDLWSSTDCVNWTLVSDKTPYDGYSEMVVFQGKLWAIKGSVWNSTDGVTWERVSEKTPFGTRGYGEIVVHDGKMWHLGSGKDVWWTTDGVQWTCATRDAPWGARWASAVAVHAGKLWLIGGATQETSDPPEKYYPKFTTHNDVWCSEDGVNWTQVLEHAPWAKRMWFPAVVYAGRLWVLGGFSNRRGENLNDVWYTEDGITWERFESPVVFSPRHEPTCYVFQDALWVVAGNAWPLVNDVWRLRVAE